MLTSLAPRRSPRARPSALVFGSFERCAPGPDGTSIDAVLDDCTRALGVPVLASAPFGHGDPNLAFVLGRDAKIEPGRVLLA